MAKLKHRTTAAGRGSNEQQAPTEQTGSRRTTDEEQDDQDSIAVAAEAGSELDSRSRPVSRETNEKLKKLVGLMLVVLAVVGGTAGYISYTKCECIFLWLITVIENSYYFADNRHTTVPVNPPSTEKMTKLEQKDDVNGIRNEGVDRSTSNLAFPVAISCPSRNIAPPFKRLPNTRTLAFIVQTTLDMARDLEVFIFIVSADFVLIGADKALPNKTGNEAAYIICSERVSYLLTSTKLFSCSLDNVFDQTTYHSTLGH
jgi:hypothetical protein